MEVTLRFSSSAHSRFSTKKRCLAASSVAQVVRAKQIGFRQTGRVAAVWAALMPEWLCLRSAILLRACLWCFPSWDASLDCWRGFRAACWLNLQGSRSGWERLACTCVLTDWTFLTISSTLSAEPRTHVSFSQDSFHAVPVWFPGSSRAAHLTSVHFRGTISLALRAVQS